MYWSPFWCWHQNSTLWMTLYSFNLPNNFFCFFCEKNVVCWSLKRPDRLHKRTHHVKRLLIDWLPWPLLANIAWQQCWLTRNRTSLATFWPLAIRNRPLKWYSPTFKTSEYFLSMDTAVQYPYWTVNTESLIWLKNARQ